ncbi:MAG: DUF2505 domain-containing protein [Haloechinothrix sp.]
MKSTQLDFDYELGAGELYQCFTDERFIVAQLTAAGGTDVAVLERAVSEDGARIVWRQRTEVEVPSIAKSMVPTSNLITQTDLWTVDGDGFRCDWQADISGAPAVSSGAMAIAPEGAGCRYTFIGEVRVNVPLLGGRLEGLAVERMEDEIRRRDAYTREHIADLG